MAPRFTLLLPILLLASVPDFGQIMGPGIGYPGGGYPRQRYPQGGQGRTPPGADQTPASTLTGMLRKIGDDNKNVIIESDDKTITTILIAGSTKYINASGGSAKIGDFQPGDHVSISANEDSKNVYHAARMTLVKEGTPDEHSAASVATDDPTRPLGLGSSGSGKSSSESSASSPSSNDPNRPKLRRAASADDTTASSSGSSSRTASSNNDDDRPRLRRSSPSDDTVANSSASSGNSSSSPVYNNDDRPKTRRAVSSSDDDSPKAQITPVDSGATAPPAPRQSAPSYPDNSDRPQLRRPAETPSADSNPAVADSRPSLHADDVNGVTRTPTLSQSAASQRVTGDEFIEQARYEAFSFSETLPNYVVKQFTTRYETTAARGGRTSWQVLDTVTADVIEEDGNERYKNILVNGKPPLRDPEKTGSWSRGEFSSLMQDVMSPLTNADFHGKRATTIVNRAAFRYDFTVEQRNSHWHVESESQSYQPAYTGAIWIDKESHRVLRIEMAAQNMPRDFPLDTVESAVDYDYVPIGEGKYLLPTHSEALSCGRGTSGCTRNVIEFRNYKKFSTETSITFDPDK